MSAQQFLFPLHAWVNMWQSLLYHTAWYTLQESCCSYVVVRVLSLRWKSCHIVFTSFISGIFFLRNCICWVTSRWTSSSAKCAKMHRLEQSKQYTTFPKGPDQLGNPHSLLFDGYQGSFLGWSGRSVKLITEVGMIGDFPLLSYTPSWCGQQKLLWCLNSYVPHLKHTVRLRFT